MDPGSSNHGRRGRELNARVGIGLALLLAVAGILVLKLVAGIVIAILTLMLLFGAKRIPLIARGVGEGIRNFKSSVRGKDSDSLPPAEDSNTG